MKFDLALTHRYVHGPGQVLPNALWKTLARLDGCQTAAQIGSNRQINHLEVTQNGQLLVYWDRDRTHFAPETVSVEDLTFALLHQDFLPYFPIERFSQRTAYFRLNFMGEPAPVCLADGFSLRPVHPEADAERIAAFISRCYTDIHPTAESVRGWTRHPVYAPDLWVWAWDEQNDQPAALAIAELDNEIVEGSLEWVQALPEYRGRGLAQALVNEILNRLRGQAVFVTAAGQVDNPSNPQQLYRHCGFCGDDIWWVLST